jgi:hypothetical protein
MPSRKASLQRTGLLAISSADGPTAALTTDQSDI